MAAGVHFGHRKSKWHPGMKPFVYTIRHNVHIIDLEETDKKLKEAINYYKRALALDKDNPILIEKVSPE